MKIKLDYGTGGLAVDFPEAETTVIEPLFRPGLPDPSAALRAALTSPTGKRPLRELVKRGQTVAISVCDGTRPQPREAMLSALIKEMPHVRAEDIVILIAAGTHRANTQVETEAMLGQDIARAYHVVNHSARDTASLVRMKDTPNGVPVLLNREWMDADFKITTGFVEPHFFAGFSGGPKMVAPGLAGIETTMVLHDARRIGSPNATWGVTEGNPVHDDVREIVRMTGVDFAFDVILNSRKEITAAFAGELSAEHSLACAEAKRDAMRAVSEPFDVVVTTNSGYPLDQNLYQAVKGMSAAAKVVKHGGTIICAAECRDGLPAHGAYAEILASRPSPEKLLEMINSPGYSVPDQWQVQIQAQVQMKARVLVKNGRLSPQQLCAAHFDAVDDVSEAAAKALRDAGRGARLCVLPNGPQTIPYLPGA